MKPLVQFALLAALLLGAAQTGNASTRLIQKINLKITAYAQGGSTTNGNTVSTSVDKIVASTSDIIQVLGGATTNAFSPNAKLLLVTEWSDGGGEETELVVEDGTNVVEVTDFFLYQQLNTNDVQKSVYDTSTGKWNATDYSIIRLALRDDDDYLPLSVRFDVSGFATVKSQSMASQGVVLGTAHQVTGNLAGTGDADGEPLVVKILLIVNGKKVVLDD